jgi:thiamine biosynthesis lipoprotein
LFNPTRLPLQIAAGDSASLIDDGATRISPLAHAFDDLSKITFHDDGRITIPAEMTLDLGGIAKGYAADVVMQYALSQGATGACVNIGGDMALNTGDDAGWNVEILSPNDYSQTVDTVRVAIGGIATSSLFARSRDNKGIISHVFGNDGPHRTDQTVGATVIANSAAWAEAWTKAAILAEPADAITTLNELGLAALLVASDGSTLRTETWKNFTNE